MRVLWGVVGVGLLLPLVSACSGGNAASGLAKAPEYQPKDQTKCGVAKSQERPLIVEWPSSDRLELETKARQGLVVVRYVGCEMSVLERCSVEAKYSYLGGTRKVDRLVMKDEEDLYANLPIGAAKLEGKLERSGQLTVSMNIVGRYEAERASVRSDELKGDCEGATHFVYGVTVGAFDFYAGGEAKVGGSAGAGAVGVAAHSAAERETLTSDGDVSACEKATLSDRAPPEGCGALVRIEVVPLGDAKTYVPTCPDGASWDGSQCVGRKVVTQVDCPPGASWNGSQCVGAQGSEAAASAGPGNPDTCRQAATLKKTILTQYRNDIIRTCLSGKQGRDEEIRFTIDLVIDPAGRATKISPRSNARPDIAACVVNAASSWTFCPSPKGYETRMFYPFIFTAPSAGGP